MNTAGQLGVWLETRRRAVGMAGAVLSVALAVLWAVVVPGKAASAPAPQAFVIRWGHSACWALLAVTAILFSVRADRRLITAAGWSALACYAAFLIATVV